jgi:hypothetical protein
MVAMAIPKCFIIGRGSLIAMGWLMREWTVVGLPALFLGGCSVKLDPDDANALIDQDSQIRKFEHFTNIINVLFQQLARCCH